MNTHMVYSQTAEDYIKSNKTRLNLKVIEQLAFLSVAILSANFTLM